ncbi:amino acid ABC transporter permease [Mesorhizobium sp. YIM 152430]|uniref:amino acid ABC transporter permease n=1 Tax=Mesorhizobium sp. YIM 152430 TaxID=3031761 RepID=UPI0023DC9B4C|nr:amino acid ABC transporter permease [Mesorhizobium sp. YIM 152430]MDF1600418.1 amino acid ABC transporter permease [Mesorhizobium sp. YIM 152430]
MASQMSVRGEEPARVSWVNDPKTRGIVFQVVVAVALIGFIYWIIGNTAENLRRANIASGFGFLNGRSGFDLSQTLIPYSSNSTFMRAIIVGLLNTLLVAVTGIITATIVGFLIGIGRLSGNWLIARICTVYVEIFRNLPPLLVIFFWYVGVLSVLPGPRQSVELPLGGMINNRGLYLPRLLTEPGFWLVPAAFVLGIVLTIFFIRWGRRRQMATGQVFPGFRVGLGLILGLPILAFVVSGMPATLEYPEMAGFNIRGGQVVLPEFLSLYLALSLYTASFIAEIVRAGVLGVAKGQSEAAYSLGLSPRRTLRLVVVPQAMRIIIPPLTSQYLNLTKNSSLAIAVGYADLVAIGQTTMNQTGQAIEVVAIWIVVYLGLSLITSAFMNWYNAKMALVER